MSRHCSVPGEKVDETDAEFLRIYSSSCQIAQCTKISLPHIYGLYFSYFLSDISHNDNSER